MAALMVKDKILGGLWGAGVGDALGVPVEFRSRERMRQDPVLDMRGYGTHNQPAGTWSDDSSLMLCTAGSLLVGFDTRHLGSLFVRWLQEALWTAWDEVFDVGGTTYRAINDLSKGAEPEQAGAHQSNKVYKSKEIGVTRWINSTAPLGGITSRVNWVSVPKSLSRSVPA